MKNEISGEVEDVSEFESAQSGITAADYIPIEDTLLQTTINDASISASSEIPGQFLQKLKGDTVNKIAAITDTGTIFKTTVVEQNKSVKTQSVKKVNTGKFVNNSKSLQLFAGAELLRTIGINDDINSNLTGLGLNLKLEKKITQRFAATLSYGLYHFPQTYKAIYSFPSDTTTFQRFTLDILALGVKYRFGKSFYISAEGGTILKSKVNSRLLFMIAPSAGVLLPLKGRRKIDIGLKFYNTLSRASLYDPVIDAGGYGILSVRVAYGF